MSSNDSHWILDKPECLKPGDNIVTGRLHIQYGTQIKSNGMETYTIWGSIFKEISISNVTLSLSLRRGLCEWGAPKLKQGPGGMDSPGGLRKRNEALQPTSPQLCCPYFHIPALPLQGRGTGYRRSLLAFCQHCEIEEKLDSGETSLFLILGDERNFSFRF